MIYIVSGFMRSGTSLMMQALGACGVPLSYSPERDEMFSSFSDKDYHPNPKGFFELNEESFKWENFYEENNGKAVKVILGLLPKLPDGEYKIIVMTRHPEEIRQSYGAFFGDEQARAFAPALAKYTRIIDEEITCARERGFEVYEVKMDLFINDPSYRDAICQNLDLDPAKVSSVVEPDLYRFRIENLDVGI